VGWLYGGYFGGWYVLLGLGFARWLATDSSHRESWGMVVFGAFAYFLLIPSLLFGLIPVLEKVFARSDATIRDGLVRRAISRGYAFAVGLAGSLVAMVTCFVVWSAASMSSDTLSVDQLGENGLAVVMVSMGMGTLVVIAACLWLGLWLLLQTCRLREPVARPTRSLLAVAIASVLAWAGLVGWLGYRLTNATVVMTARLDFAALPASDEPLQTWLRSQPGLAGVVSRQGNTVVVECTLSVRGIQGFARTLDTVMIEYTTPAGEKRSVDLTRAAAESGYGGLTNADFDRPRRQW
jgi:hypothetical protein